MNLKERRKGWSLKRLNLEFNLIVAKVGAVFEKNQVPKRSTMAQRTKIRREVKTELVRIAKEEKQSPNVVAETVTQIADRERKKAIRRGDYATAVIAGIVQYHAEQANKPNSGEAQKW